MAFLAVTVALSLASPVAAVDPTVTLYNGVEMPMVGAGTWQYNSDTAYKSVQAALELGYTHIDTANNYGNQDGVGKALKGRNRTSYFLTTKIPGCKVNRRHPESCYDDAQRQLSEDLSLLDVQYVDLMLVHFPPLLGGCGGANCKAMQAQWKAMEELYRNGSARAIGVSNFCQSCFECLKETQTILPMVNQVAYHIGMGPDPEGLFSYAKNLGVVMQAYSPLGNGAPSLIHGPLTTSIGERYNKSSVQVALKWVVQHEVPVLTKSTNPDYLAQDIDLFDFTLSDDEMSKLDAQTTPAGTPSFTCTS
mmetsp:Transcript_10857/g.15088  ORF Transcript_10857/g.15088 Transcript_10857/m.15088 type:complete len:306 (+) Transcript_10857:188-1105(+)|eukprot:CAMPEP_0184483724 /NCGR_PEP_ID=MMETSP0113_2-20130426/5397_1 /TAXON_ID=91329 /ORGANISM="Norrisiella sphaerica, Strain BC52" /LENGTH=305 /DNA_ID=CAMNT_0026864291 /DNA_START=137 /DNA_END=1054 /DNA_ORIENTATION=+